MIGYHVGQRLAWQTRNTNFADVPSPWSSEGWSRGWNGYDLINWVWGSSSVPTAMAWRDNIFPVQTEETRNIYYMANTFQIWKKCQANFIELINTQYRCARVRVNIYKELSVTVHSFKHFEKPEWNKLVRTEMKAGKYVPLSKGNHRAMPRRQTELSSPESTYNSWS